MKVKLNTYHWSIQWNSMVMQVEKTTYQRMGSGKGKTENIWDVSVAGQSAPPEVYISTVSTSRSQRLTISAKTDLFW
jgi:hypothetical protein